MAKAVWNGVILAESDHTEMIEGNHYFPPESISREYFRDSGRHTTCPWKGIASYYDIVANGQIAPNAAWYYPDPKQAAAGIRDHVAFYGIVKIEK
jgi:uncharacterized protein (DUF427 family)